MDIELTYIFVQVVKNGSFTKAAASLRLPKSTVSKAVSQLESETGTKLLVRTTRSQNLTAAGKAFYDTCVGPLQIIEDAQKSLFGNDNLLTGTIRITAPEDLGTAVIAPAAGQLTLKHPGLTFELLYTDEVLDLVKDGIDLAVRIGTLKESGLNMKKMGELKGMLVASEKYLKKHPRISKPEDLKSHSCLALGNRASVRAWNLKSKTGSTVQVKIQARMMSNQMSSLLKAAAADAGVALVPYYLGLPYVESGELQHILPQWTFAGVPVNMLSPLPFTSSARLRMVSDYFAAELQRALK